jgi:hypothetical protein
MYAPSTTSREAGSITPTPSTLEPPPSSPTKSRTGSVLSANRSIRSTSSERDGKRPMGPRSPSRSPRLRAADIDAALNITLNQLTSRPVSPITISSSASSRIPIPAPRPTSPAIVDERPSSPYLPYRPSSPVHRPTTPMAFSRPKTPLNDLPPIPFIPLSAKPSQLPAPVPLAPQRIQYEVVEESDLPEEQPNSSFPRTRPPTSMPTTTTPIALNKSLPTPPVEPLSIKKKASVERHTPSRKGTSSRNPRDSFGRRLSNQARSSKAPLQMTDELVREAEAMVIDDSPADPTLQDHEPSQRLMALAESTLEDVSSTYPLPVHRFNHYAASLNLQGVLLNE